MTGPAKNARLGGRSIGASPRRREDRRFVTGTGRYTSDLAFDRMAHAWFVRSSEAHGRIVGIDVAGARGAGGVIAVFTGRDIGSLALAPPPLLAAAVEMVRPVLAEHVVRYVGEPVALVVADDAARAEDAAEEVFVDIEPLPAVTDPRSAQQGDALLFPEAGSNEALRLRIESARDGMDEGPVQVSVEVRSQRLDPMTMETYAAVAVPEADGTTTLWCGAGGPLAARNGIAEALGIDPGELTVRVPDVGGAFGQRGGFRQEYVALVAAARDLGLPIKWVAHRREQFVAGEHGRDLLHHIAVDASADGVIHSARMQLVANLGAYPHRGWLIPRNAQELAPGSYRIPRIEVSTIGVVTNTAPTGPYRGAGRPEAALAIERALDAIADATGISPEEVRRRNFIKPGEMPTTTATGLIHDGGDYAELARRARELMEERLRHRDDTATLGRRLGVGYASFVETTGQAGSLGEYARVEWTQEGITLFTGSVSTGQGHETVWPQIVSDVLGVPEDLVTVVAGDTSRIPAGTGTYGSRSAPLGGTAILRAAEAVREMVLHLAAELLEADPGDLALAANRISVKGVPGVGIELEEVLSVASERGISLVAEDLFTAQNSTLASGCYGAAVAVDMETGSFELLELVAVDDCGVQLNPMIVIGQIHGGIAQGLGQALFERIVYADTGQPLTTTLIDYSIPDAPSLPRFTTAHVETPSPGNPLGVKGAGEAGSIGAPPAVLAAVRAAIGDPGSPALQLPLRPEVVWRAARAGSSGR